MVDQQVGPAGARHPAAAFAAFVRQERPRLEAVLVGTTTQALNNQALQAHTGPAVTPTTH